MSNTTPLIIYKASAGSGKTFTLATEYIKLVVRNPQAYRQILAVTFTNKATEEMKMRILSQLYGISNKLPSSKRYCEAICRELDATPEYVSRQAGIALSNLLHNYSYFRIDTIDSFFQSILRNLARELDLTANLTVGLNDRQVEEQAVDELIENLSATDLMLQWILKYIMESISDDRSWNIIGQVKTFGRTIFKDFYKAESARLYERLRTPHFIEDYTALLRKTRDQARQRMKEIGDEFFSVLEGAGFTPNDLSYGTSGVSGLFIKLRNGIFDESILGKRILDSIDAPETWCKKTHPQREAIVALANGRLGELLRTAAEEQPLQWKLYKSADLTLLHLSQLRLLESIEQKVRELNESSNRFLLSDTQQLLHDLIKGSDSPFIFEKIGTQLEHIMIDEFQDTSTVQWQNFKVLLQETMSHSGTENLIVGDVKQSIYRWRSGDWRLLGNIREQFPHADKQLEIRTLDTNFRSSRYIIYFNNAFFSKATQLEQAIAYDDVKQQVPAKRGDDGYVSISLLPAKDYQQEVLNLLLSQIADLIEAHVPTSEIGILVRSNNLIPLIANFFMEAMPQVPIVSDEAFRLDASPAVQTIIHAIRYLANENDLLAKGYLALTYSRRHPYLDSLNDMLPEEFVAHCDELRSLPLYELAERLFAIFHLQEMEGQSAYLCAFYDSVAKFVNEQTTDLSRFLKEWDETISLQTIQSPDINGIRIISIHKSKGLEFPYVLIPFCDWKMEHNDILWCRPLEAPFSELPIVPIDYSQKGMKGTVYQAAYEEEHQQNTIDNMNLLYVAFTRAKRGLYVIGKRSSKGNRSAIIEQTLPEIVELLDGAGIEGLQDAESPLVFEYGDRAATFALKEEEDTDRKQNIFLRPSQPTAVSMQVFDQKVEFRQSNDSRKFALMEDDEQLQQESYIQMGSVLHNVFSTIRTTADIDSALQRMELDGILYDRQLTRERIKQMIRKRIEHPQVADWYSPRWTLFNECAILSKDPKTGRSYERRPDRVMIDGKEMIVVDFKFGRPNEDYHDQVREYMQLLASMGYQNIRGYLWYVYANQIDPVQPKD